MNKIAPGPHGSFLLGNMRAVQKNPLEFLTDITNEYGDVVRYPVAIWRNLFLISHPEAIKHVLVTNQKNYSISLRSRNMLKLIIGNGLFTNEGSGWRSQRRLMQPTFSKKHITIFGETMVQAITAMLNRWHGFTEGQMVDLVSEMTHLTLAIAAKSLFHADISQEANEIRKAVTAVTHSHAQWIRSPAILLPGFIVPHWRKLSAAIGTLDKIVYHIIAERRQTNNPPPDILSQLLNARDSETGERMSNTQIRDEVMTLLLAGHETTANALMWTFYLLSQHPEATKALQIELDSVLGGRLPNALDIPKLTTTSMIAYEALRLYPPVWTTFRKALADDEILGYHIPAGSRVTISPYVTHRRQDLWNKPLTFMPSRFATPPLDSQYLPFGAGQRQCLGKHFAMLEIKLVLAMVAQQYQFKLASPVKPKALTTLRPNSKMEMILLKRF